jgi:hypothetical protein
VNRNRCPFLAITARESGRIIRNAFLPLTGEERTSSKDPTEIVSCVLGGLDYWSGRKYPMWEPDCSGGGGSTI